MLRASPSVPGAAVQLDGELRLELVEHDFRAPGRGEVRVRVEWAAISAADLEVARTGGSIASWPAIQGHAVFGRIDAVGPGVQLAVGTPLVADPRLPCRACRHCAMDADRCRRMSRLGEHRPGGFATHCLLPATNVLPAGHVDGSIGVLTEPLARGLHAIELLGRAPKRVAVLGHGPVGALLHIALRLRFPDVEVAVAEALPARVELARAYGAAVGDDALVDRGFDAVFDAGGALARALSLCDDAGQVVVLAPSDDSAAVDPLPLVQRELVVRGARGSSRELPRALRTIAEHPQAFRPVITEAIELRELPAVLRREMASPRGSQVVVRP